MRVNSSGVIMCSYHPSRYPKVAFAILSRMIAKFNEDRALALAREVLQIEALAVRTLAERIDSKFATAVKLLLNCQGRVVVSGMGKSGHIARKLAATFASTGTPAFFVHPGEARHGDLGMITAQDVVVTLSNSGETEELVSIAPLIKRMGAHLIALTGCNTSSLAKLADVHLNVQVEKEACPLNLAPTASTTATLALGDALAVAVLDARSFSPEDFARSHPGGALGRRLLNYVTDVMRTGAMLPQVSMDASVHDAILEITAKRLGMTAVINAERQIEGIFTDGDLRRTLVKHKELHNLKVTEVMTTNPHTIRADQLAVEAIELMEHYKINQILVVDATDKLIGALNMHDLFNAKVV